MSDKRFTDPPDDAPEWVVDSPKGAVIDKTSTTGGRSYNGDRTHEPPAQQIEKNRLLYDTDPHVGHAVDVVLDWLLADGYNISERRAGDSQTDLDDVQLLRELVTDSTFTQTLHNWVKHAAIDGHAFMEIVVQNGNFRPRLLPFERMHKFTDEYGQVQEYILEPPDSGGVDSDDATQYAPSEVAEFTFHQKTLEQFGRSLIERVQEQANMLRDMEIDYARFIASKAYPPILWKLGSENNEWSEEQISNWLEDVENIEPDSELAGPHDVEAEVVGTTSTSASAGAMRLEETFKHHERRVVTGLGVPAVLANMDDLGASTETIMPAFKRRIRRYQNLLSNAIERQILKPLFVKSIKGGSMENYDGLTPEFDFGEYSNAEDRLETDKLIKLFNNGMLTREAFAKRAGIDPETELPEVGELSNEILPILQELAGNNGEQPVGDSIQNPDGGRPSDTGGGAQSSGREVTSREDGSGDQSGDDARPRQSPTEDENA